MTFRSATALSLALAAAPAVAQTPKLPVGFVPRINATTGNVEMQDGQQWVPIGTVDPVNHKFVPTGVAANAAAAAAAQATANGAVQTAGGDASLTTTQTPGGINPRLGSARFGNIVSILEFAPRNTSTTALCSSPVAVTAAFDAAVAAGYKRISIPASCTLIPDGNTTPADVEIFGDDWRTSVISVANRATDLLAIGPRAKFHTVGIISSFCDQVANPTGTPKVCPVGDVYNNSDASSAVTNWAFAQSQCTMGTQTTGPNGVISTDSQCISVLNNRVGGDGIYIGTGAAGASGVRAVALGNGDTLFNCFDGLSGQPTAYQHSCLSALEYGDVGPTLHITRIGNAVSDLVDDSGTTNHTSNVHNTSLSHQTSGFVYNIYQAVSAYSSDVFHASMANGGGTFNGNFLAYDVGGIRAFQVDANGNTYQTGAITAAGSITTASNFRAALKTPVSSSAACTIGDFVDDANYHYVCTAANHWRRIALTDF